MKTKCFITFIVLASMLGWVAVTVPAANGGDGGSGGVGGNGGVGLQSPIIKVHNMSGKTIWMYNVKSPWKILATDGQKIVSSNIPTNVTLLQTTETEVGCRIYFVESEVGFKPTTKAVDVFNPTDANGNVGNSFLNYTFVEYKLAPDPSGVLKYTIDVSYVDEWSLPVQMKFNLHGNPWPSTPGHPSAQDGFLYGFKNFETVATLLKHNNTAYAGLVWAGKTPWIPQPPPTVSRIIGPDKVWPLQSGEPANNFCLCNAGYVPMSYSNFICGTSSICLTSSTGTGIPWNAKTYSKNTQYKNNLDFWLNSFVGDPKAVDGPSTTPYPTALHLATHIDGGGPDKQGKYGFFTYPNDNTSGEFTYAPIGVSLDLFVYGSGNSQGSTVITGGVLHHSSSVLQPLANRLMQKIQRAICVKVGAAAPYVHLPSNTVVGTAATDTFIMNYIHMEAPLVKAFGTQGDIVAIDAPTLGATSTSVEVVDRASFKRNPSQSQFVYERSTGILYYDQNPSAHGYTGQLCKLSKSSLDLPKLVVFR